MKIAFIGGGPIARSVASLARAAGHKVVLGVRNPAKEDAGAFDYAGFAEAFADSDIVILAIPYYVLDTILPTLAETLAGKIVVDATNPVTGNWEPIETGEGSGAEHVQTLLPKSRVAKAFNTIFADVAQPDRLDRRGHKVTAFVASDHSDITAKVVEFGSSIGFEGVDAGPLKSARYLEAVAHLQIELALGRGGGTNAAILYDRAA